MSKIGESLLRGAQEALLYVQDQKKGSYEHKVKPPQENKVSATRKNYYNGQSSLNTSK